LLDINNFVIEEGTYNIFVGANGKCKVSINVGGKIFRTHHDEIKKGLIQTGIHDLTKLRF
jgi:hypothetical protein